MRKALIAFGVAFSISTIFAFFSILGYMLSFRTENGGFGISYSLTNALFWFLRLTVPFLAFYLLAHYRLIKFGKGVFVGMLAGTLLGAPTPLLMGMMGFNDSNPIFYFTSVLGFLLTTVSALFFPAFSGLLLSTVSEKKNMTYMRKRIIMSYKLP